LNIKIGIDLDDCVFDTSTPIIERLNEEFKIDIKWEDLNTFELEEQYNLDKKKVNKIVQEVLKTDLKPIFGAVEAIKFFTYVCDGVYLISFRKQSLLEHTVNNLAKIGFTNGRHKLILTRARDKDGSPAKWKIVNENDIDIIIEDRADTIESLYKNTKATILVFDRPWNRSVKENDRIYIMERWNDIRQFVLNSLRGG
jgi:5'(3')-deoxyribonucleotidase